MTEDFPTVLTKHSQISENPYHYLWVFSSKDDEILEEDLSTHHAPVLSWESSVENLESKHTGPIPDGEKSPKGILIVKTVEIDDNLEEDLIDISKMLDETFFSDSAEFLKRFLSNKNAINLHKAIEATQREDLVLHHRLCKIAEKLNIKKGK